MAAPSWSHDEAPFRDDCHAAAADVFVDVTAGAALLTLELLAVPAIPPPNHPPELEAFVDATVVELRRPRLGAEGLKWDCGGG